jgi:hypothetical protein
MAGETEFMRLWSLHPRYLDRQGLVALWREALLAQAVLRGATRGYRSHPQLIRFKNHPAPLGAIARYLEAVYVEATARGYAFDRTKYQASRMRITMPVTLGQVQYEWTHLRAKLQLRSPATWHDCASSGVPDTHPLFKLRKGVVESWERRRVGDVPLPDRHLLK